jgi:hypothetical protein
MTMPTQFQRWTPDEDRKLLEMIESGKSWVLISAVLKRKQRSIIERTRTLKRLAQEDED